MSDIKTTTISVAVHRAEINPIFGEGVTRVSLDDETGGPFVVLRQYEDELGNGEVRLEIEELRAITAAAEKLIADYPEGGNV